MIALLLLLPGADVVRVVEGRLGERAALVLPLSARPLDRGIGAGASVARDRSGALPMSVFVSAGTNDFSLAMTVPWVSATHDPLAGTPFGNVGFALRANMLDEPDLRAGLLIDAWGATARRTAARARVFALDSARFTPRAYTLSVGAGALWKNSFLVAGANAGIEGRLQKRPGLEDSTDFAVWWESWIGAPFAADQVSISPQLGFSARSSFELVADAGASIAFGARSFTADHDAFRRVVISAGYQLNVLDLQEGRVVVAIDVGILLDSATYRERS